MRPNSLPVLAAAFAATLVVGATAAFAGDPATKKASTSTSAATKPDPKADPRAAIVKKIDGLKLEDVRMTPVNGIYEITRDASISYSSSDGRYVIVGGDLIDLDADANLTEARRRALRNGMLDSIPASEMLVFSPKNPKYTVTVFTDIDCGYCRRLHSQIAEYNKLGIGVRYLFYPRSGPDTESWQKAEAVWCAKDRNDALTRSKNGETIKSPKCPTGVISRDWELGHKFDLQGTPAIVLPSGEMLEGYATPTQLAKYLKTGKG